MKTKIIVGVAVLAIAIFFGWKMYAKKLSPFEKMTKDILDPNTPAGKAQRDYLKTVGGDINSPAWLLSFVEYRKSNPTDPWAIAYNKKKSWGPNEVVNI